MMPSQQSLERMAITLATGATGGVLFWLVGMPLPFLTGSAAASAVLALAGYRLEIPHWMKQAALVLIGALLGASVTPETLALLPRWPVTLAGLACAVLTTMIGGAYYLERVHGYDRATARLASLPGAVTQVMALAADSNADARRITIIQITRLAAILLLVPSAAALMGLDTRASLNRPGAVIVSHEVVILLLAAAAGAVTFTRLRTPAPLIIGSMAAAALLYGTGTLHSALPEWLLLIGFVVIGSIIGANFVGTDLTLLGDTMAAALGSLAVCSLVALAWAVPLALLVGISPLQVWLAYAPGGVETSAIIAMAVGLDVAFVSSHHVVRVLILNLTLPWWLKTASPPADDHDETDFPGAPPRMP